MSNYYCGVDIGSTYGKGVLIDDEENIISSVIVPSKLDPEKTSFAVVEELIKNSKGKVNIMEDIFKIIGTGYGRDLVPFADQNISEISCHAMGVHVVAPSVRTIADFGGQDLKGISIDEEGSVENFHMNDKCAAGTGRFFEVMARIFEMDLDTFSNLSLEADKEIPITSQCSVFAETEVISMISKKKNPADIALGIQMSVARRCQTLLRGAGLKKDVTVTGGCAKNEGLVLCLEKLLKTKIVRLTVDPQLMGALGAAEYARKRSLNEISQNKVV